MEWIRSITAILWSLKGLTEKARYFGSETGSSSAKESFSEAEPVVIEIPKVTETFNDTTWNIGEYKVIIMITCINILLMVYILISSIKQRSKENNEIRRKTETYEKNYEKRRNSNDMRSDRNTSTNGTFMSTPTSSFMDRSQPRTRPRSLVRDTARVNAYREDERSISRERSRDRAWSENIKVKIEKQSPLQSESLESKYQATPIRTTGTRDIKDTRQEYYAQNSTLKDTCNQHTTPTTRNITTPHMQIYRTLA